MTRRAVSFLKRCVKRAFLVPYLAPKSEAVVRPIWTLQTLGSDYGGWTVPTGLLSSKAVCYCVGVGEDITFDLELLRRFRCEVFAYDPTPRAAAHVDQVAAGLAGYHFSPMGVWDRDETVRFFAPANPDHVSHSAVNLQRTTAYFEAECRRLATLFRDNGHTDAALLKLDVEGAEYRIIRSLIEDRLNVDVLCVEFDEVFHPLDEGYPTRIRQAVSDLAASGYTLVAVIDANYTFVRNSAIPAFGLLLQKAIGQRLARI